jgi:D-xylose transport system substrate-binding protein
VPRWPPALGDRWVALLSCVELAGVGDQFQAKRRRVLMRWTILSVAAVVGTSLVLAACGSGASGGGGGGTGGGGTGGGGTGKKIALLLPENTTARYETQDRPNFENKVKQLCPDCSIVYENANQDASQQQSQADSVLTQGVDAMVLDPVDAQSASTIVANAKAQNVPVISYDRLVSNADLDAYISFDNVRVGKLQATALASKLKQDAKPNGPIVMINGAPTDNNAHLFKQGASSVFSQDGVKVAKTYDTPDWTPAKAQNEMQQAITALGNTGFAGVYAANDGTAGGAIAAMKAAGIDPATRPTTGQDAELAGVQRILAGDQYMTVYKAVKPEAYDAAEMAVALAQGKPLPSTLVNQHTNNGKKSVPSVILTPVAVTKANIESTVVKDGYWTPAQICTSAYASACRSAGIK